MSQSAGMFYLVLLVQTALPVWVIWTIRRVRPSQECHRQVMLWAGIIMLVIGGGCFIAQTQQGWGNLSQTRDWWRIYLIACAGVTWLGFRIVTRKPLTDRRGNREGATTTWKKGTRDVRTG